jgi:hypothetical protein
VRMKRNFGNPEIFFWDGFASRAHTHLMQDIVFDSARELRWALERDADFLPKLHSEMRVGSTVTIRLPQRWAVAQP